MERISDRTTLIGRMEGLRNERQEGKGEEAGRKNKEGGRKELGKGRKAGREMNCWTSNCKRQID